MARAGAGEGSIRKRVRPGRPDRWEARYSVTVDDRRVQRSVYGTSRAAVAAKLREALNAVQAGETVGSARQPTVGEFLNDWLASRRRLRPTTLRTYRLYAERHIIPSLGRVRLRDLTPQQVDRWLVERMRSVSPRTARQLRAILLSALSAALKQGLVVRNVAALADPPEVPKPKRRAMTKPEADAILAAVRGTDIEAPVALGLLAGLRMGEVLGLRHQDVDLDARVVRLRQTWQLGKVAPLKTERSKRDVPITPRLGEILSDRIESETAKRAGLGLTAPSPASLLLTSRAAEPLSGTWVTKRFVALTTAAGCPRRRFHDLRHGYGALLYASGVPLLTISRLLGHSTITTTGNIYVEPDSEGLSAAVATLDTLGSGRTI